jgi:hypothetical protein
MFTSLHVKQWLEEHILSGAKVYNDTIPPSGRLIYVRMLPGAGYTLEGIQDNPSFTLETRGADRNFDDAEYIAKEADDVILKMGGEPYFFSDGTYMYFMGRTGGGPSQLLVSDSAGRYAFTCNYYATVATDL